MKNNKRVIRGQFLVRCKGHFIESNLFFYIALAFIASQDTAIVDWKPVSLKDYIPSTRILCSWEFKEHSLGLSTYGLLQHLLIPVGFLLTINTNGAKKGSQIIKSLNMSTVRGNDLTMTFDLYLKTSIHAKYCSVTTDGQVPTFKFTAFQLQP